MIEPLRTFKPYYDLYLSNLPKAKTCREAWEMTEDAYQARHGGSKFSSYESFKSYKSSWLKSN